MKSKWFELKEHAISLRKKGFSIGKIEKELGIPRSTLSGWLKNIKLNYRQKKVLKQKWRKGLAKARKNAVIWHNEMKLRRIEQAEEDAKLTLEKVDLKNNAVLELVLAFLYLGEGSKKNIETSLGSSDYKILKIFLTGLNKIFGVKSDKIRCELYLRADQNPLLIKKYWSQKLEIPISNFRQVSIDKRTIGKTTYSYYKGVCNLRCGNVAIQRKLLSLSNQYIEKII